MRRLTSAAVCFVALCLTVSWSIGCGPMATSSGGGPAGKSDGVDQMGQWPMDDVAKANKLEEVAGDPAWCGVTRELELPYRIGRKVYFAKKQILWTSSLDKGLTAVTKNGKRMVSIDTSVALKMCKDWVPSPDAEDPWDGTCKAYKREYITLDERAKTGWQFQWAALEMGTLAMCSPGEPHRPYDLPEDDPRRYNNTWKITVRVPPPALELWLLGSDETPLLDGDAYVFDTVGGARSFIERASGENLGCGDPIRYHYQSKSASSCRGLSPIYCGPNAVNFSDQCGCGCRRELTTKIKLEMQCGPRG